MSRDFFNSKAEEWDQMVNHDPEKIRQVMGWMPAFLKGSILDVGSGTGVMIPFLKERFGQDVQIVAIDFAEKMIDVSKRKHECYPNLEYIVGDVTTYPLPENQFELIMCYSVFPHFEDKRLTLGRLKKALRPGGSLFIFHSQSREAINNLHRKAGEEVKEDRLPPAEDVAYLAKVLGYSVGRIVDNEEMYVVELRKGIG